MQRSPRFATGERLAVCGRLLIPSGCRANHLPTPFFGGGNYMAWRPSDWVLEGELDNTTPGWTTGWIRLEGKADPLTLKLAGNCHPDLAGWKFRIVRTEPSPDRVEPLDYSGIATDQSGTIGDVTADQRLYHYECTTEQFLQLCREGKRPPTTLRPALYLEWFSHRNGRVVIQSTRLAVERLGERAFELTEEQWLEQAKQNQEEMAFFMHQIADALEHNMPPDAEEDDNGSN
jgi:hypothetical protein